MGLPLHTQVQAERWKEGKEENSHCLISFLYCWNIERQDFCDSTCTLCWDHDQNFLFKTAGDGWKGLRGPYFQFLALCRRFSSRIPLDQFHAKFGLSWCWYCETFKCNVWSNLRPQLCSSIAGIAENSIDFNVGLCSFSILTVRSVPALIMYIQWDKRSNVRSLFSLTWSQ